MAFNPLKVRPYEPPVLVEDKIETLITKKLISEEDNTQIEESTPSYEGEKISDLQESGMNTSTILDSIPESTNNVEQVQPKPTKQRFNTQLLDSTPLAKILLALGATLTKNEKGTELYTIYEQQISLKENKWYNKTQTRGLVNAISLITHLNAIKEGLDDKEQDVRRKLFFKSCQFLNELQTQELENTPVIAPVEVKEETPDNSRKDAAYFRALTEQLDNISLDLVLEHIGSSPNEDGQRGKWKVHDTSDNIAVTGQKWYSWKNAEGGNGAIGLLAYHLANLNNWDLRNTDQKKFARREAINELIKAFGYDELDAIANKDTNIIYKVPFSMPHVIQEKNYKVREYLNQKRNLPLWVIDKQMKLGFLFAGFPSDWANQPKELDTPEFLPDDKIWATFLSSNGTAAEMRAIARNDSIAKILAKGSDKEQGGFVIKAEKELSEQTLTTVEASIDAMSYHSIYPGRIVTSGMGVNFNLAVKVAKEALERGYKFELGFDNDQAGNEGAVRFRNTMISSLGQDIYDEISDTLVDSKLSKDEEVSRLGLEAYQKYYIDGKIKYFDLGIQCLQEAILTNQIFYFDVQDNATGLDAVRLFQSQAIIKLGSEFVHNNIALGNIKYLNVCPEFGRIHDIEKEAQNVYDKLNSGKPYYFRMKLDDEDSPTENESHNKTKEKAHAFIECFKNLSGQKFQEWEANGLIIHEKKAVAKDWNEYFIYLKENKPEFLEQQQALEEKFAHYSIPEEVKKTKKKGKKP